MSGLILVFFIVFKHYIRKKYKLSKCYDEEKNAVLAVFFAYFLYIIIPAETLIIIFSV